MKCPYTVDRASVTETRYDYSEDGKLNLITNVDNGKLYFKECIGKECMAYRRGKCRYNG